MPRKSFQLFGNSLFSPISLILIANVVIYLFQIFDAKGLLIYHFGLIPHLVSEGFFWQIFTYGFLHSPGGFLPIHLLFNMYAFFMLSTIIGPSLGNKKLVSLYFLSQLGGGILVFSFAWINLVIFNGEFVLLDSWKDPTIGASGAVFGLLAVFGLMFPEMEIYLLFIRVQARNAVWISLFLGYGLALVMDARISNTGHLGGALSGFAFYYFFLRNQKTNFKMPFPMRRNDKKPSSKANQESKQESLEDVFGVQLKTNKLLLGKLQTMPKSEKTLFLETIQVPDANICPSIAFNPEDSICLRCEWIANCALRKEKENS